MAQIGNFFSVALVTAALFASCSKDKNIIEPSTTGSNTQLVNTDPVSNRPASTANDVQVTTGLNERILFTAGYINASRLLFQATLTSHANGDAAAYGTVVKHELTGQQINIYYPQIIDPIKVTYGHYNNGSLLMQLDATNGSALFLDGTFSGDDGRKTPVRIAIDRPIRMEIRSAGPFMIDKDINFLALLTEALPLVARHIDTRLWDEAARTDGTILVSSTSNVHLYRMILENMQTATVVNFKMEGV